MTWEEYFEVAWLSGEVFLPLLEKKPGIFYQGPAVANALPLNFHKPVVLAKDVQHGLSQDSGQLEKNYLSYNVSFFSFSFFQTVTPKTLGVSII